METRHALHFWKIQNLEKMPVKAFFLKINFENTCTNGGKNGSNFQVHPDLHTKSPKCGKIWLKYKKSQVWQDLHSGAVIIATL